MLSLNTDGHNYWLMTPFIVCSFVVSLILPTLGTAAALVPIEPINLRFDRVSLIVTNGEEGLRAGERMKKLRFRRAFLLDSAINDKQGTIWCKRDAGESYKDEFRVANVSLVKLESLRKPSECELSRLLGEPMFVDGPMAGVSIVYEWRVCNGKAGNSFSAVHVIAGFNNAAATNAVFVLVGRAGNL